MPRSHGRFIVNIVGIFTRLWDIRCFVLLILLYFLVLSLSAQDEVSPWQDTKSAAPGPREAGWTAGRAEQILQMELQETLQTMKRPLAAPGISSNASPPLPGKREAESARKKKRGRQNSVDRTLDYSFNYRASSYDPKKPTANGRTEKRSLPKTQPRVPSYGSYGVRLVPYPGRGMRDGIAAFQRKDYRLASTIIMENRYTADGINNPDYSIWLLKSLLAAHLLALFPQYIRQLQPEVLRLRKDPRSAELYYLIGRYYFAIGDLDTSRDIFIDYLDRFKEHVYVPNSYYWIARILEREGYLEEARTVYLLVVSYFSRHYLNHLARYKAGVISLYLLKNQAEDFLRSRGVDWRE